MYCTESSKGFILCTVQEAVQSLYCVLCRRRYWVYIVYYTGSCKGFILCTVQKAGNGFILCTVKEGVRGLYCVLTGISTDFILCTV